MILFSYINGIDTLPHILPVYIITFFLWLSLYPPNDHAHDENGNTTSFAAATTDDSNNKEEAFFILFLLRWRNCCYFVCPCGAWLLLLFLLLLIILLCMFSTFFIPTMFFGVIWKYVKNNAWFIFTNIKITIDKTT